MSEIADHRPHFSIDEATRLGSELYNLNVKARELPSERDQNFHLTDHSGQEYVLKISSSAEQKEILELQNQTITRLDERHGTGRWPRVCPTVNGQLITVIDGKGASSHMVRMLTYVPGVPLVNINPHTPDLLHNMGGFLGHVSMALEGFVHSAVHRDLKWDIDNGPGILHNDTVHIPDAEKQALVKHFLAMYEAQVVPELPQLRRSIIQNDANDHNILVDYIGSEDVNAWDRQVVGLIDFGDMVQSHTVCELAVALAYVMLRKKDPFAAAAHVIAGYHRVYPLTEQEIKLLYHFVYMRVCMSVTISAHQQKDEPENTYLSVSEQAGWDLLMQMKDIPVNLVHYTFRNACGLPPCPQTAGLMQWLRSHQSEFAPLMGPDIDLSGGVVFDLSVGSTDLALLKDRSDVHEFTDLLFGQMKTAGATVGVGRYNEPRQIYAGDLFILNHEELPESRTIHLGLDLFLEAGAPVYTPLDATVHSFRNNTEPLDYGPCIILEHVVDDGRITFYTLYGHLSTESLDGLSEGMVVKKGDQIATLGDYTVNGGWPPHLHFQIVTDMLGRKGEFPGVGSPSERAIWLNISPGPNVIVGVPEHIFPSEYRSKDSIIQSRQNHIGKSLSISYDTPLKMVRGHMQYLYDDSGRAYLDAVNNVPHVGHSHPRVVEAGQRQMAILNTNTRYLHDNLVIFAERLCGTMPEPLDVCFFVNSGSEANDLALRLARNYTGRRDLIILDGAYHGNLSSLIEISPYKFDGPGGLGAPPHVHKVEMPDPYRGQYKGYHPDTGEAYAKDIYKAISQVHQQARHICGFMAESLLGCGGQVVLPDNYLKVAYQLVRSAGGLCIADEVQVGFGRAGTHYWGFETQDVVPDIVTLGKPIGNGHPLAAVVTTREIADAFANGMEYFNTFGGNPVSCAIGMAVLDVIRDEKLQENALEVGNYMMGELRELMGRYELIGDVRGLGFYIGVELVLDRETLAPAAQQATYIANRMKDHGILISTDGPLHNVLKIKPPMVFNQTNADRLVGTLDKIMQEDFNHR